VLRKRQTRFVMHELALAQNLMAVIQKTVNDHGGGKVSSATLKIGALTHVEPETLGFAFSVVTRDTCAEGCQLYFERLPLVVRCSGCNFGGEVDVQSMMCPRCGAAGLQVVSGREIELSTIDLEESAHA